MKAKDYYPEFDEFDLCQEEDGKVALWGYGEYPQSSVLAGGYRQAWLEIFDSVEEAQAAYPDLILRYNRPMPIENVISSCPPPDFDPMDAGEVWDEEDY